MNVLFFLIALILPIITGFLLVSLCWPDKDTAFPLLWCKLCLSVGVGLGLSSFTSLFTMLLTGYANIFIIFLFETAMIILFAVILHSRRQPLFPVLIRDHNEPSSWSRILAVVFYTSLFLAICIFVLRSLENPHGEPDAWTFWNLRARLFFRTGEQWRQIFSHGNWAFAKYPQLTTMNVVRLWASAHQETFFSPVSIAFLFSFATLGVLVSALTLLRGRSQGMIAGILLASTPYFLKHGASQYADVPVGYYILTACVLLCFQEHHTVRSKEIFGLIGLCAGLAIWTKQEGWLLQLSLCVAYGMTSLVIPVLRRKIFREIGHFAFGFMPILTIVMYFNIYVAPQEAAKFPQTSAQIFSKLLDVSRYLITGKAFLRQIIEPYSLVYSTPLVILFLSALFLGLRWQQFRRRGVLAAVLILMMMFAGYFVILLTTPHDLAWQIQTTLTRLFLQLWPSSIFIAFMIIATPEESDSRRKDFR